MLNSAALTALIGDEVLLATKLYLPQPRPNLVARPHLVDRLNLGRQLGGKITVISAPPGSGKTTLLSEWLAGGWAEVAWLALDARDNEPARFFGYCLAALQTIQPEMGQAVLAALNNRPLAAISPKILLTMLINEMAALRRQVIFVLDDYHLIESNIIHSGLAFLLDNLPPPVHLVIASRADLPLPLARLRARGQLTELRGPDLRFSPAEAAAFLQQTMQLNLSAGEIAVLEERTEGWIAGLQMAALSMQGQPNPAAVSLVQQFSGSHRYVLDYLLEEVLQRQPPPVQHFLLRTSILDRLCGPLADAMTNGERRLPAQPEFASSQAILEYLDQANLFIIPLDNRRQWYRYHHLFADLLRNRLPQTGLATQTAHLHQQASDWFEQNGLPAEAMQHALAAVDVARIIRLARQKAAAMLSQGELVTLLAWLDALPQALLQSSSGISLLKAWAMVLTGQLESVEPYLQQAELEADISGEVATLRATVAYFKRDMAQAVQLYRQALDYLPADSFLRGCVVQSLGAAHSWCGQVVPAAQAFTEASAISRRAGNLQVHLVAEWTLALLQVEQGHLQQAAQAFQRGLELVNRQPPAEQVNLLPFAGRLHVGLAGVLLEQNNLEPAQHHLAEGLALGQKTAEAGTLAGGYLVQARLRQAQADAAGALAAAQQAALSTGPYYLVTQVAVCQARLWLAQNNRPAVIDWLKTRELALNPLPESIAYDQEDEYLLLARLALAQADSLEAQLGLPQPALAVTKTVLAQILAAAQATQRTGRVIEVMTLQALWLAARQQPEPAVATLAGALALAAPERYIRIFLDEGPALLGLLRRAAAQNTARDAIARLLAAAGQSLPGVESAQLFDPLSERELEILQLIADGKSNKELADALALTVGTIKWHLNNIYSKLGARSRTQAIALARDLGFIR